MPPRKKTSFKKQPLTARDEYVRDVLDDLPDEEETPVVSRRRRKVAEDLRDMYSDDDGRLPDMRHMEARQGGSLRKAVSLFMTALIFFAGAGAFALWYMDRSAASQEDVVAFSIQTPESVSPGEMVPVRVIYKNTDRLPIAQTELRLRLPDGFSLVSASPSPYSAEGMIWKFGTLIAGESGAVDMKGVWQADAGEEQSFRGFFAYRPANFSSSFESVATQRVRVASSLFGVAISAPEKIIAGSPTAYTIRVEKTSSTFASPAIVRFVPEKGFSLLSSSLRSSASDPGMFVYPFFATQTNPFVLMVTGTLAYASSSTATPFTVSVETEATGTYRSFVLSTSSVQVSIEKPALRAELFVNGGTEDVSVKPGDMLLISTVLTNDGDTTLKNVEVNLNIIAGSVAKKSILNWLDLKDDLNGTVVGEQISADTRKGGISWNKKMLPALASIVPGASVRIDIAIPVKDKKTFPLSDMANFGLSADVAAKSGDLLFSSVPVRMTLNSDLSLATEQKITTEDDVQTYVVTWVAENTFHSLKDITVEAELFGDISFAESDAVVPAGKVSYDAATKKIRWSIPEMPDSVDVLALRFPVGLKTLNPTQKQLTSKPVVTATDTVTNKTIRFLGDEVLLMQ